MRPRADVAQALLRLLGPGRPELGCDECFACLDRYVDLEVAGADADAAIPGCASTSSGAPPAARSTPACGRSPAEVRPAAGL